MSQFLHDDDNDDTKAMAIHWLFSELKYDDSPFLKREFFSVGKIENLFKQNTMFYVWIYVTISFY